ncbi:MAG: hypothetical protein NVS2B12_07620 [Ktedonobacteraceae bacterium]
MENMAANEPRRRPIGVTIIAVLLGIESLFEIVLGILAIVGIFALGRMAAEHGHTGVRTGIDIFGSLLGGASLVIGILTLIFVVGLWMLRRWAFWLTVIVEVITLLRHALEFTGTAHPPVVSIVLSMLLPAIILIYFLLDPYVRRAFRI